jgi:chemotaxis protein MotB
LETELATEIDEGKIALSLQPRGLVLSLREAALFPSGLDRFTAEALPTLTKVGNALRNLPRQPVRLEGHTDNVPIETHEFPSNWELSAARAMAVLGFLNRQFQIEPQRLALAGYADSHPVADNSSAEGRAKNRRVDIVVLSHSAAAMEPRSKL